MTRRALPWLRSTPPGSATVILAVTPIRLLMWWPSSAAEACARVGAGRRRRRLHQHPISSRRPSRVSTIW